MGALEETVRIPKRGDDSRKRFTKHTRNPSQRKGFQAVVLTSNV